MLAAAASSASFWRLVSRWSPFSTWHAHSAHVMPSANKNAIAGVAGRDWQHPHSTHVSSVAPHDANVHQHSNQASSGAGCEANLVADDFFASRE